MEYDLHILANWINTYIYNNTTEMVKRDEDIAHWLHGLMDDEVTELLTYLTKRGLINYVNYFNNL